MNLETNRLILRDMTEEDYDALYEILADSDIMKHYPYTFDEARVREWIRCNIERYNIFGFGLWAVCLKETGEVIGDCGLTMQLINGKIKPEIGYHIRKNQQMKGYAKEAALAVRDWAFNNTPFNMIYSYMKSTNVASIKTAKSYGGKQVDEFKDNENEMTKVYAISREEWDFEKKMLKYKFIRLRELPEIKEQAAEWFRSKWGVPKEAYLECMNAYLKKETEYGWYLCLDDKKIIGGMGVIENDFHNRKDLTPNVCAVYTEENYRCQGIAGHLLNMVVKDLKDKGISPIYLITDHIGFYERYGWEFLCMVQGDGQEEMTRMYIKR